MTGGDIAGLIAAGVFAVLVALLAVPIIKLGKVFDELRLWIRDLNSETEPLIDEVVRTVATTNSQLAKVDGITDNVSDASANVSAMTSLVASTVGQPIIKVAALSSGVRRAFSPEAARLRREETHRMRAAAAAEAAREEAADVVHRSEQPTTRSDAAAEAPTDAPAEDDVPDASTGKWWEGTEWDQNPGADGAGARDAETDSEAVEDQQARDMEDHDVIDVEYSRADSTDAATEQPERAGAGADRPTNRAPRHREEDR